MNKYRIIISAGLHEAVALADTRRFKPLIIKLEPLHKLAETSRPWVKDYKSNKRKKGRS